MQETIEQGFAIATGEWHDGLNAIALGFIGPSGERYAVNCGGSADQCPRDWLISRAAPALLECVSRIVLEIGGTPGADSTTEMPEGSPVGGHRQPDVL